MVGVLAFEEKQMAIAPGDDVEFKIEPASTQFHAGFNLEPRGFERVDHCVHHLVFGAECDRSQAVGHDGVTDEIRGGQHLRGNDVVAAEVDQRSILQIDVTGADGHFHQIDQGAHLCFAPKNQHHLHEEIVVRHHKDGRREGEECALGLVLNPRQGPLVHTAQEGEVPLKFEDVGGGDMLIHIGDQIADVPKVVDIEEEEALHLLAKHLVPSEDREDFRRRRQHHSIASDRLFREFEQAGKGVTFKAHVEKVTHGHRRV